MFMYPKDTIRELSNKVIIQSFLKNFHLRQSHYLARIPKVLLDCDWVHQVVLCANLTENIDRTVPLPQFEHEVIIPMVDEVLFRVERMATDCDAIIFHALTLTGYVDGRVESLDGVSARILTLNDFSDIPSIVARIDIAFTPMWLRKTTKSRLYYVEKM